MNWQIITIQMMITDSGPCEFYGCTDSDYLEYDTNANVDDGSCET